MTFINLCNLWNLKYVYFYKSVLFHAAQNKNQEILQLLLSHLRTNKIKPECFKYYIKLSEIVIPSFIKSIGNHCFDGCLSLKQIIIPNVTSIGDSIKLII